jgi:hypothetical protein
MIFRRVFASGRHTTAQSGTTSRGYLQKATRSIRVRWQKHLRYACVWTRTRPTPRLPKQLHWASDGPQRPHPALPHRVDQRRHGSTSRDPRVLLRLRRHSAVRSIWLLRALPQGSLRFAKIRPNWPQTTASFQIASYTPRRVARHQRANTNQGKMETQKSLPTLTQSNPSSRSTSQANTLPQRHRHSRLRLSRRLDHPFQHYQHCRQAHNCRCEKYHCVGRHLCQKLDHPPE